MFKNLAQLSDESISMTTMRVCTSQLLYIIQYIAHRKLRILQIRTLPNLVAILEIFEHNRQTFIISQNFEDRQSSTNRKIADKNVIDF